MSAPKDDRQRRRYNRLRQLRRHGISVVARPRGWNLRGPHKVVLYGKQHPNWKGDGAAARTKRERAQRWYPLGQCERCPARAEERHHRDRDIGNNRPSNIERLCKPCHRAVHRRMRARARRQAAA